MNAAAIFTDLYATMTEAHAAVRVGRDVVARALCSGLDFESQNTEYGSVANAEIMLRILAADELDTGMELGKSIEVKMDAESDWHKLRIRAKMATGGVMRYSLEAEFA